MKWSVVGLVLLGLFAAVCATLLVGSLRADASRRAQSAGGLQEPAVKEVNILIAANEMRAMTVVDARSAVVKRVLKAEAPPEYFSDPIQVAGQVLALPMVEGQVFSPACFVTGGSGKQLAAVLQDGMRAVSVSLADYSGMNGILYPGSIVDVLVSLKLPSTTEGKKGDVISTTLLERIQVLAIEDRMVVSSDEEKNATRRSSSGRRLVTLMVTLRQAEMIRLATENGTVSLAMRNPLDAAPIGRDGVLLSQLSPSYAKRLTGLADAESPANSASEATDQPQLASESVTATSWEVLILRGASRETRSVPQPTAQVAGQADRTQ